MASTPLAGCSAEIPEGEAAEEAYEEDQLDSAQAALCDVSQIPPHDTGTLVYGAVSVNFSSGSVNYTDNCADYYVIEMTNHARRSDEGFDIATWWNNTIGNASICSGAHVEQTIYGYDPEAGAWEAIVSGLTATGEWGTHGGSDEWCKVEVAFVTESSPLDMNPELPYVSFRKYSKIRVMSQAWQYHAWGPSFHPVSVEMYKGQILL
ncbi:hypothetical protein [Sorangium sp. So ce1099]|uniref:hypothetical protein n=1 Tax=Sorangium sp. So ce1099 TaxID=3133331 RepID=UPI003F60D638